MFKRKKIQNSVRASVLAVATAMAGMGAGGLSTSASAVSIAADGLGEVLIFPYYSARNSFASFFNITNTSDKTVIIKVRWNEGENSRDARDFNVIMSPYDIWSVATIYNKITGAAHARTADNTCTSPLLPVDGDGSGSTHGLDFTHAAYTGSNKDTGNTGLDRTREGYFTVFQMGVIDPGKPGLTPTQIAFANDLIASAKHDETVKNNLAIPGDGDNDDTTHCGFIDKQFTNANISKVQEVSSEPINVLKGRAVLIHLTTGVAQGYDPITLADFSNTQIVNVPAQSTPNLDDAIPAVSTSVVNGVPTVRSFIRGVDAVTDLLSRTSIINDYNLTDESQTDWVITFPTKGFYVDKKRGAGYNGSHYKRDAFFGGTASALPPFSNSEVFSDPDIDNDGVSDWTGGSLSQGKSCVEIIPRIWDREEFEKEGATSGFSPFTQGVNPKICKEANILSFGNSNIFDSKLRSALFENDVGALPGLNGWAQITFANPSNVALPGSSTLIPGAATPTFGDPTIGLPVTGMRLEARENSKWSSSKYGFASDHAYTR